MDNQDKVRKGGAKKEAQVTKVKNDTEVKAMDVAHENPKNEEAVKAQERSSTDEPESVSQEREKEEGVVAVRKAIKLGENTKAVIGRESPSSGVVMVRVLQHACVMEAESTGWVGVDAWKELYSRSNPNGLAIVAHVKQAWKLMEALGSQTFSSVESFGKFYLGLLIMKNGGKRPYFMAERAQLLVVDLNVEKFWTITLEAHLSDVEVFNSLISSSEDIHRILPGEVCECWIASVQRIMKDVVYAPVDVVAANVRLGKMTPAALMEEICSWQYPIVEKLAAKPRLLITQDKMKKNEGVKCFRCNLMGHFSRNCSTPLKCKMSGCGNEVVSKCTKCGDVKCRLCPTHCTGVSKTVSDEKKGRCYVLKLNSRANASIMVPPSSLPRPVTQEKTHQAVILDSGANVHVVQSSSMLSTLEPTVRSIEGSTGSTAVAEKGMWPIVQQEALVLESLPVDGAVSLEKLVDGGSDVTYHSRRDSFDVVLPDGGELRFSRAGEGGYQLEELTRNSNVSSGFRPMTVATSLVVGASEIGGQQTQSDGVGVENEDGSATKDAGKEDASTTKENEDGSTTKDAGKEDARTTKDGADVGGKINVVGDAGGKETSGLENTVTGLEKPISPTQPTEKFMDHSSSPEIDDFLFKHLRWNHMAPSEMRTRLPKMTAAHQRMLEELCVTCKFIHAHKTPQRKAVEQETPHLFTSIHCDLEAWLDSQFVVSVEHNTGYPWIHEVKTKDACFDAIELVVGDASIHDYEIRTVRTDAEAVFTACQDQATKKGLMLKHSEPYKHDGEVERAVSMIKRGTKALARDLAVNTGANIGRGVAKELLFAAAELRRLTPNRMAEREAAKMGTDWCTPWELYHRKPLPEMGKINVGNMAVLHIPVPSKALLAPKARVGVVLRPCLSQRRWHVLMVDTGRIVVRAPESLNVVQFDRLDPEYHEAVRRVLGRGAELALETEDDVVKLRSDDEPIRVPVRPVATTSVDPEPVRRSSRTRPQVNWAKKLQEFDDEVEYAVEQLGPVSRMGGEGKVAVLILRETDPQSRVLRTLSKEELAGDPERKRAAEKKEVESFVKLGALERVKDFADLSEGQRRRKPLKQVVVYTTKPIEDGHGDGETWASRLCVNGSPMPRSAEYSTSPPERASLLVAFAIALEKGFDFYVRDIGKAFLNVPMVKDGNRPLVRLNQDFSELFCEVTGDSGYGTGVGGTTLVLPNSYLFGFRDSPKAFETKVSKDFRAMGYKPTKRDSSFFVKYDENGDLISMIFDFVDDMFVFCKRGVGLIEDLDKGLADRFPGGFTGEPVTAGGPPVDFVGLSVGLSQDEDGRRSITLSQKSYIEQITAEVEGDAITPMSQEYWRLDEEERGPLVDESISSRFRSKVAEVMWVTQTLPEVRVAVQTLASRVSAPRERDVMELQRCLQYVRSRKDATLTLRPVGALQTIAVGDASFATGEEGKSMFGVAVLVGGALASVTVGKGTRVQQSAKEAELQAQNHATNLGIIMAEHVAEILGYDKPDMKVVVVGDNLGAIDVANMGPDKVDFMEGSKWKKATTVDAYFNHEMMKDGVAQFEYVSTGENVADVLTKPLAGPIHKVMTEWLHDPGTYVKSILRPRIGVPRPRGCNEKVSSKSTYQAIAPAGIV